MPNDTESRKASKSHNDIYLEIGLKYTASYLWTQCQVRAKPNENKKPK